VLALDCVRSTILVAQLANGGVIGSAPASESAEKSPDAKKPSAPPALARTPRDG